MGVEIVNDNSAFWPVNYIPGEQTISIEYDAIHESFSVQVWNFEDDSSMSF